MTGISSRQVRTHAKGPLGGPFHSAKPLARNYAVGRTFVAWGPFCPSVASNSTFAPSERDLKPSPEMPVWWTNRSFDPSSGVMKPYPFSSLNPFTVPVANEFTSPALPPGNACPAGSYTRASDGHYSFPYSQIAPCARGGQQRDSRRPADPEGRASSRGRSDR